MIAHMFRAATTLALLASAASAVGPGFPETVYEQEVNDTFEQAQVVPVHGPYVDGKLGLRHYAAPHPDTYMGAFDKTETLIAQDDNSSWLGDGKASALFGLLPIPDGDGGEPTIRLWITGRPDGLDNDFNGLFFNGPHHQLGEFTVLVDYVGLLGRSGEGVIASESQTLVFQTGAESFRVNFFPPPGTISVNVQIDNTTGTTPVADDVDFYVLENLEPLCDYVVTVIGGLDLRRCRATETVLGWFDKNGNIVRTSETSWPGRDMAWPAGANTQLSLLSDANGRVRIAVSGRGDHNFNGLVDFVENARNIDTPPPPIPFVHGVYGCYTLLIDSLTHGRPGPHGPVDIQMSSLEHGDLNLDGGVDVIDLALMLNNYGWTMP